MLTLRNIDYDTLPAVTALHVANGQRGFVENGETCGKEIVAVLTLKEADL